MSVTGPGTRRRDEAATPLAPGVTSALCREAARLVASGSGCEWRGTDIASAIGALDAVAVVSPIGRPDARSLGVTAGIRADAGSRAGVGAVLAVTCAAAVVTHSSASPPLSRSVSAALDALERTGVGEHLGDNAFGERVTAIMAGTLVAGLQLGLDERRLGFALGIAGSQVGMHAPSGESAELAATAARIAVESAVLAQHGFTATTEVLATERGLADAFGLGDGRVIDGGHQGEQLGEIATAIATESIVRGHLALPAEVHRRAVECFANCAGLAVAGVDREAVRILRRSIGASPGASRVLGTSASHPIDVAATLMGSAMHVDDFDDTYLPAIVHPGPPVVAAALAIAYASTVSRESLITAVAVGSEVTLRLSEAWGAEHLKRGWHTTGTAGTVGAAVAAGLLVGLDAERMTRAILEALVRAAGLTCALGTMTKALHAGRAAGQGVISAITVLNDPVTPNAAVREVRSGELPVGVLEPWGNDWLVKDLAFKPYPCGVVAHPVIDAALALRRRVDPRDVASFFLRVNPFVPHPMGIVRPLTGLEAKFSTFHCFAVALIDGEAGPLQYTDEAVQRSEVKALIDQIAWDLDESCPLQSARVTAVLKNGTEEVVIIEHALGSRERPMAEPDLRAKLQGLLADRMTPSEIVTFCDTAFGTHPKSHELLHQLGQR